MNYSNKNMSFSEMAAELNKIKNQINDLLYRAGDECDNLRHDRDNLDEAFMHNEYRKVLYDLQSANYKIEYLTKPISEQGYIKHNDAGRYQLPSGEYFTTGDTIEVLYNDTKYNEQYWVCTTIKHNGDDYYAAELGEDFSLNGAMIRVRK